jgi:3-dehydrosphinganine reductase
LEVHVQLYRDQIVFVIGGSEGIGKETAKALVLAGAHVHIFSRSRQKLDMALSELQALRLQPSQRIQADALDVTQERETLEVLNAAVALHGVPRFVINCAGYARPGYIDELDAEHFRGMMDLNYFGAVHVCKAMIPHFRKAGGGHLVNTSSIAGFVGLFGYTGYCASKYAIIGFSDALRSELEQYRIRVSVLCPPNTRTPGLVEENRFKPAEVLKVEEKAKTMDAKAVARVLLKSLPRNKFLIVPSLDGKLALCLSRIAPAILRSFTKRPVTAPPSKTFKV